MTIRVLYFAQLAEQAGSAGESLDGEFVDLAAIYETLRARYGFTLVQNQLRVARNQAFAEWSDAPANGDEIAFIPPVAGG